MARFDNLKIYSCPDCERLSAERSEMFRYMGSLEIMIHPLNSASLAKNNPRSLSVVQKLVLVDGGIIGLLQLIRKGNLNASMMISTLLLYCNEKTRSCNHPGQPQYSSKVKKRDIENAFGSIIDTHWLKTYYWTYCSLSKLEANILCTRKYPLINPLQLPLHPPKKIKLKV